MNPLIQKIILATDFSEASQDACLYARWLSGSLGAELKILHVFEPSGWMVPSHYYYTPGFEKWVDASIENTRCRTEYRSSDPRHTWLYGVESFNFGKHCGICSQARSLPGAHHQAHCSKWI